MKSKLLSWALITLLAGFLISGSAMANPARDLANKAKAQITHLSNQQLKKALATGSDLLIDIREPDEFAAGHIKGAVNIPRGVLIFKIAKKIKDTNTRMILYCKSGSRSALSTLTLNNLGYKNTVDLAGGIKGWASKGNIVYSKLGEMKVLAYGKKEK